MTKAAQLEHFSLQTLKSLLWRQGQA